MKYKWLAALIVAALPAMAFARDGGHGYDRGDRYRGGGDWGHHDFHGHSSFGFSLGFGSGPWYSDFGINRGYYSRPYYHYYAPTYVAPPVVVYPAAPVYVEPAPVVVYPRPSYYYYDTCNTPSYYYSGSVRYHYGR